jgi:YtcA-like protein
LKPRANPDLRRSFSVSIRKSLILIAALFFESCGSSQKRVPSMDVFGSYFPAWLISLATGIVLTVIAGGVGRLVNMRPSGFPSFFLNISLILIFSIAVWFWFFAS